MEARSMLETTQNTDRLELLESLSQHSSVNEDRGAADWDFDISEAAHDEEKAKLDAIFQAEDLRMAKIKPLVGQYFRCAKPAHYGDFSI